MSAEHPQHTHGQDERPHPQTGCSRQVTRRRNLWWVLLISELFTFASSWIAFWLTLEVVSAGRFAEQNPVVDALLGWSTAGLAAVSLCGLAAAFVLLRVAGARVTGRAGTLFLSAAAGAVAALNLVDAGWNLLLLVDIDAIGAVGAPGPATLAFGVGAVVYLCTVPLLFRRRYTA